MEEQTKKSNLGIAAGILFIISLAWSIWNTIDLMRRTDWNITPSILQILFYIAQAAIIIALVAKLKAPVAAIGFAVMTVNHFFNFCASLLGYFEIQSLLMYLLLTAVHGLAALISGMCVLGKGDRVKRLWFLPGLLHGIYVFFFMIISSLFTVFYYNAYWDWGSYLLNNLSGIISVVALFLAMHWFAYPWGAPRRVSQPGAGADATEGPGYFSLAVHVLLLLFTFGIWKLIWIYQTTLHLNRVRDEEARNPTTKLLLCIFVPFYSIYWTYKSAQRIDKLAREAGVSSDLATLCLILAIFVDIIPPILMQDKINAIATAPSAPQPASPYTAGQSTPQYTPAQPAAAADELKKWKDLLDQGAITEEEYNTKKQQLLGL